MTDKPEKPLSERIRAVERHILLVLGEDLAGNPHPVSTDPKAELRAALAELAEMMEKK